LAAIISLAIKDLSRKWALALVMSLLFGTTFGCYFAIKSYQNNLSDSYGQLSQQWLVVQESNGVGEIHGSRLSPEIGQLLVEDGYEHPIPEIHQVVGTSLANGMLMRGISLADYTQVTAFKLESGKALATGDDSRLAMVGSELAEIKKIKTGGEISIRGRKFSVVGIFNTGTYQDNEVWISLADAQALLNYGRDVSIFFIPDGGKIKEGKILANGISVGRKGESGNLFGHEIVSFYTYMGMVATFAGVATVITLTNLLWRLAWLRRHEFGILRTLGFGRWALLTYLFVQAMLILVVGLIAGLALAFFVIFTKANQLTAFGMGVAPIWNITTILDSIGIFSIVLVFGIALPAIRINRTTIPGLLGRD
jgi:ABC-type antimicrobial peptide transport system permease subunit